MPASHPVASSLAAGLLIAASTCLGMAAAQVSPDRPTTVSPPPQVRVAADTAWWRDGIARLGNLWSDARLRLRDDQPDWLHHQAPREPPARLPVREAGDAYVALQENRADGTDLVTVRYPLGERGDWRAYAGAGLNHTQYFIDDAAAGPASLTRRNRRSAVGPAAELGAELALSQRVHINADLRWVELDDRAELVRGDYGPVAANPLTLGLSVGYRFR